MKDLIKLSRLRTSMKVKNIGMILNNIKSKSPQEIRLVYLVEIVFDI